MKLKFEKDLEYQLDAINAIVEVFDGQGKNDHDIEFVAENGAIPNILDISKNKILENLREIQKKNTISKAKKLDGMDFTVEMETGTGKTYVYLRTILELNQKYGFKKFIIVVPSVAIREGVLKTLEITKRHFRDIYDNLPYKFYEYDSSKLNRIRQFSRSNNVEIMVMTLDSFNKASNIMNNNMDQLSGDKPIDFVRLTRPILILDEPQNMESEKSREAIASLNPLFNLRYSATHRRYYNLVYRLTPVDAFNQKLVKKIEVLSVIKEGDFNNVYICCLDLIADKKGIKAKLEVNVKQKYGFKRSKITVDTKKNNDLLKKTGLKDYSDFKVTKIDVGYGFIEFGNGVRINKGEEFGGSRKELMQTQIREAIEQHCQKADLLRQHGIKVLSLFFIDRVANYTEEDGFIRKTFEEEFESIKKRFKQFSSLDVDSVHSGYFSKYKRTSGMEGDKEAFDLIMKDKERLLSFEEPVQFIFSHSALREGWDNPNVFNICTLNESISDIRKRQEIGRGVRLPVNQKGERIKDLKYNILTVVANESYREYVSTLQREYIDEYGSQVLDKNGKIIPTIIPSNAKARKTIKLKKGFSLDPEFKELWSRISNKTKYAVELDSDELIQSCVDEINKISTHTIKIKIERVAISLDENYNISTSFIGDEAEDYSKAFSIPNLIDYLSKETHLTRATIFQIISKLSNLKLLFSNPAEYIQAMTVIIQAKKKDYLVNGIKYIQLDDLWNMQLFENLESYEEYALPVSKSIYEEVIWDSEGEKSFAQKLEENDRVKLFIKLPRWFTVTTPIGEYNPDWAIVFEERDISGNIRNKLYLVRETKFLKNIENLRPSEKQKIKCAKEHFQTIGVDFKEIKSIEELI